MKYLKDIKDWQELKNQVVVGDCLEGMNKMPDGCIDCVITSPPYWGLRDYGHSEQIGIELTLEEYIAKLCLVFDEIFRVLKSTGTCFVNLGDIYKNKRLLMVPERFAIALIQRGWVLRNQIIWHKSNQMPESVTDRFTVDFEKIFFLVKSSDYYFEQQLEESTNKIEMEYRRALRREKNYNVKKPYKNNFPKSFRADGKRNMRAVWTIPTKPFSPAHFATYPEDLCKLPILAGCPDGGVVCDPFMGSWTTARVCKDLGRDFIGFELSEEYCKIGEERLRQEVLF